MGRRSENIFSKEDGQQVKRSSKSLSGKCKSKPWWDIISYLLEQQLPKKPRDNKCRRGCEKRAHLWIPGENTNWYGHYGKPRGGSSKKKIKLPYYLAIQFWLFIRRKKILTQKDICTPMFTAALFIIAKTWK